MRGGDGLAMVASHPAEEAPVTFAPERANHPPTLPIKKNSLLPRQDEADGETPHGAPPPLTVADHYGAKAYDPQ